MGSSHPLVAVGVGVLVALSYTSAGYSQEHELNPVTPGVAQSSPEADAKKLTTRFQIKAQHHQIARSRVHLNSIDPIN